MAAAPLRGISRRAALAAAAVLLTGTGCTYEDREPGLLDRDRSTIPPRAAASSPPPPRLPPTNPALPVLGEHTWTSADGWEVQIRIAVHAVRRLDGASVLDWSITPVEVPNLRPGDSVPDGLDLGLVRPDRAGPDIALVDVGDRAVYRPLARIASPAECLCTPLSDVQRTLRVGVTTLLQTAYPELPGALRRVDVAVATVPVFSQLPVTPVGRVPAAVGVTDLRRPSAADQDLITTDMFRYGAGEQVFRLGVRQVVAGRTSTSLEWAVVSVTGGAGLASASTPPFAARDSDAAYGLTPIAATGPTLRVAGRREGLRASATEPADSFERACLCTDLRGWPSVLRRPDKVATVVTTFAALPPGTRRIEVLFPGQPPISLPVTPATGPATTRSVPADAVTWASRDGRPAPGWDVADWPTPVPDSRLLEAYESQVDRLLP